MKDVSVKFLSVIMLLFVFASCSDDDAPPAENEEEVIDQVTLIFTPDSGSPLTFVAEGSGGVNFTLDKIELQPATTYTMEVLVKNVAEGEDITQEILTEASEHMFFFGWTEGFFTTPTGNGNIDNRADQVSYQDQDVDGLPLGLVTRWVTGASSSGTGEFRTVLKHQPDIKSATTDVNDGETDIDLTWEIAIL